LLHHLFSGAAPDTNRSVRPHSVPVVLTAFGATKGWSGLLTAGLTCSLHLRIRVWQEIG
jgi:hypothetical protein